MKKRLFSIMLVIAMLFVVNVCATSPRANVFDPDITFNGTEAICTVCVTASRITDTIVVAMELRYGNTVIDSWTHSGSGFLQVEETATVQRGKTYTLVVDATINGVAKPTMTISRTND